MNLFDPAGAIKRQFLLAVTGITGIALLVLLSWALRLNSLRQDWRDRFEILTGQAASVLTATRIAADHPQLRWENVPGQVIALGESKRDLEQALATQNYSIDQMAAEAVRLRAQATEMQRIADRAQAQRQAALTRLSNLAITAGTRDDCMQLLREAEHALDLVYQEGV